MSRRSIEVEGARQNNLKGVSVRVPITAPVRTSRSTVGTMTSVADYLRALYARAATLHCRGCGQPVRRDTPSSIFEALVDAAEGRSALVAFPHRVGRKVGIGVVREAFEKAGFRRVPPRAWSRRRSCPERWPPTASAAYRASATASCQDRRPVPA